MKHRSLIIYLIFVATVAYGFHFHFFSDRAGKGSGDNKSNKESPVMSAGDHNDGQAALVPATTRRENDGLAWKRDPFRNDRRVDHKVIRNNPSRNVIPDKPRVTAISRIGGEVMVIADGRLLKIGEKSGPWRLIDIQDEAALFDGPGGWTWVRLGGSR